MVLITVGTGIGGGLVLDGTVQRGATGLATELGHIILNPDGPVCGCGNHGCFEAYASGTALGRMAREAAEDAPDGLIARLGADGRAVVTALRQGDAVAAALFARLGRWLGVGIASLANIFEVEAVLVGGGLVETGELLLEPARVAAREYAYAPTARGVAPVLPAKSGGDAGMIGAALLALEHTSVG
jgi:glucokinase